MKEFLSSNGVEYAYIDITASMLNLKKFLKLRDTRDEYREIREAGRVGIPVVVVEDKLFFDEASIDIDWLKSE